MSVVALEQSGICSGLRGRLRESALLPSFGDNTMNNLTLDLTSLAARVEKLELQNRWLKRGGVAVILLAVVLLSIGRARTSRTVEAERFLVKDVNGKVRAELAVSAEGLSAFRLYDLNGNEREVMGVLKAAPFLALVGNNAHLPIFDDNDKSVWSAPTSAAHEASPSPCPTNDPLGLFTDSGCSPLPPKNKDSR
jgi:hypothetical protein